MQYLILTRTKLLIINTKTAYILFYHAEFLSIHFKLRKYQRVIGTIIASQLQSSIKNILESHGVFGNNIDHGMQYIENKILARIRSEAPFLVDILENARKTQIGVLSFFSIKTVLPIKFHFSKVRNSYLESL